MMAVFMLIVICVSLCKAKYDPVHFGKVFQYSLEPDGRYTWKWVPFEEDENHAPWIKIINPKEP
eukprot:UN22157